LEEAEPESIVDMELPTREPDMNPVMAIENIVAVKATAETLKTTKTAVREVIRRPASPTRTSRRDKPICGNPRR
jgi:hypothetical protein